jgi:hypothetical protein
MIAESCKKVKNFLYNFLTHTKASGFSIPLPPLGHDAPTGLFGTHNIDVPALALNAQVSHCVAKETHRSRVKEMTARAFVSGPNV